MSKTQYRRPRRSDLLLIMALNSILSAPLHAILFWMFGAKDPLPLALQEGAIPERLFGLVFCLTSGILFGCLWYWLIARGRLKRVGAGGATLYGIGAALALIPISGGLVGLLEKNPLLNALIAFVLMLVNPGLLMAVVAFGILLGMLNSWLASRWLATYGASE